MTVSAFENPLLSGLFGDPELADFLCAEAQVSQMIAVEAALARAQGRVGVIPAQAAQDISDELAECAIAPADLARGTASAGVPVPALVAALRRQIGGEAAHYLHWGATSQDIVDCATALQLRDVLTVIEARLNDVIGALQTASQQNAGQLMAARTRSQVATPITFGLRIARWAQPLIAVLAELPALRARLLRVQFGGASGANTAVSPHGPAVSAALAEELGLADSPSWHCDRSAMIALSAWMGQVGAALGKMARDLTLMGRSESGEAIAGSGGGSSTMPQKANPVQAEAILTLAGFLAAQQSAMMLAASPAEERDGALWALEWLVLPNMLISTGVALRHATDLARTLKARPQNMEAVLEVGNGAVWAEALSFALMAHMPRSQAQASVKDAIVKAQETGDGLRETLAGLPHVNALNVDWAPWTDKDTIIACAQTVSEKVFAAWSGKMGASMAAPAEPTRLIACENLGEPSVNKSGSS